MLLAQEDNLAGLTAINRELIAKADPIGSLSHIAQHGFSFEHPRQWQVSKMRNG